VYNLIFFSFSTVTVLVVSGTQQQMQITQLLATQDVLFTGFMFCMPMSAISEIYYWVKAGMRLAGSPLLHSGIVYCSLGWSLVECVETDVIAELLTVVAGKRLGSQNSCTDWCTSCCWCWCSFLNEMQ